MTIPPAESSVAPAAPSLAKRDGRSATQPGQHLDDRERRAATPRTEPGPDTVAQLRLSIGRDGLGIELGRPVRLGCVDVTELSVTMPGVKFPLDVSGGVARFRHRRGILQRASVEVSARVFEKWAAPKLRGVLGPRTPSVWVTVRPAGATIALVDPDGKAQSPRSGDGAATDPPPPRILAFELTLDTQDDALHLSVVHARGAGLPSPPTTLAIAAVHALLGRVATREGARFTLSGAASSIARALLPDAGARAPSTDEARWVGFGAHDDAWLLYAASFGAPAETTAEATRAMELCQLAREADDARFDGDLERARTLDVAALERAPRHRAISRRIAEMDQLTDGRAEAALATLIEAERDPLAHDGLLIGELLTHVGDVEAAIASFVRVGETEPVPALGARAFERAAELTSDPLEALAWLDLALARAPDSPRIRWARLARRLAAGRLEDALADAEHLEAQASGARARHAVWRKAGEAWQRANLRAEAGALFERALRFDPDDAEAIFGLGVSLVDAGRGARGVALVSHAVDLAEARGAATTRMVLELARGLAGAMGDRPAAIARVRTIPLDANEALEARGLEARWRAELGDLAGASLAYARVRDLADSRAPGGGAERSSAVAFLVEGATFESDKKDDILAAQRHLACALRLAPHDAAVQRAYRDIGARIAGRPDAAPAANEEDASEPSLEGGAGKGSPAAHAFRTEPPSGERVAFDLDFAPEGPPEDPEDAARAEELTRLLHADPLNDAIVDELAMRLTRLGRTHDLLALLSARLEDASPERRAQLVPAQREVLARLEKDARAAGREGEASLFRDALAVLESPST